MPGEITPDTYVEPTTDLASRRPAGPRPQPGPDAIHTEGSPSGQPANQGRVSLTGDEQDMNEADRLAETLILPSSTYRSNRHSMVPRDTDGDGGEFLIPVAFDPSEEGASRPASGNTARDQLGHTASVGSSRKSSRNDHRPEQAVRPTLSESSSPHIAYQEKGRERLDLDATGRPSVDTFQLQDAPRGGKPGSPRSSESDLPVNLSSFSPASPESIRSRELPPVDLQGSMPPEGATSTFAPRPSHELSKLHENNSVDSSRSANGLPYPPKRGDSLHQIHRKELVTPSTQPSNPIEEWSEASTPGSGVPHDGTSPYRTSFNKKTGKFSEPPRARPHSNNIEPIRTHARGNSISTLPDSQRLADHSPSLPRYSTGGDLSTDEEVLRMMNADDPHSVQNSESFLRRVSNSVRHGRSFSDKSARFPKRPRTPINGTTVAQDIGSPSMDRSEEVAWLRNELRKERQYGSERDQKITEMETLLKQAADVKQVTTELHEKRSTMVVLDAQKEIAMRELSVLMDHLEAEKRGATGPMDLGQITNTVLREFVASIQKLKESYAPQVEELIQKRNDVKEELANLNRMKEKSLQEFEQLSSKNAQLAELNNQLVHQIQELYRANSDGNRGANGLGIYSHNKEKSVNSIEAMKTPSNDMAPSVTTANLSEDAEPATVIPGTQVVSIRKGQPRKFNWKKGGQNVAKGVKGLKGAFMSSDSTTQEGGSGLPRSQTQDPSRQGFGFFGNQRSKQVGAKALPQTESVSTMADAAAPSGMSQVSSNTAGLIGCFSGLYGTDLEQRMEYEKSIIPGIVTRCIQEVELRGEF